MGTTHRRGGVPTAFGLALLLVLSLLGLSPVSATTPTPTQEAEIGNAWMLEANDPFGCSVSWRTADPDNTVVTVETPSVPTTQVYPSYDSMWDGQLTTTEVYGRTGDRTGPWTVRLHAGSVEGQVLAERTFPSFCLGESNDLGQADGRYYLTADQVGRLDEATGSCTFGSQTAYVTDDQVYEGPVTVGMRLVGEDEGATYQFDRDGLAWGEFTLDWPAEPGQTESIVLSVTEGNRGDTTVPLEASCVVAEDEPPVEPEPPVIFDRYPGKDRYDTARMISEEYSATTTSVVYVASGADQSMVDAIAGGPAAAAGLSPQASGMSTNQADMSAPVLLVRPSSLPGSTRAALERFDNLETIVVLGGVSVISQSVAEQLSQYGTVVRIAGDDRYETAALVAMMHGQADRVYVASGRDPSLSDALTAGALAGYQGYPVLLVRPDNVPGSTMAALTALQPSEIVVLGGPMAVSNAVYQDLGATDRLAGSNRYGTAALVAAEFGPDVERAFLATGLRFPDALAGSALAAREGAPVLLTRLQNAPGSTLGVFRGLDELERVTTLGGPNAVSEAAVDQVRQVVLGQP